MIQKKASKNIINGLNLTINELQNMPLGEKIKLSENIKNFEDSMTDRLHEEMLISVSDKKKRKKRKNKKGKKETSLQKKMNNKKMNPESDKSQEMNNGS